jgi:hypothetical protein
MALAMIYPDPAKGGRGRKSEANTAAKRGGFSADRLDAARAVQRHSRALAEDVLPGRSSLDALLSAAHPTRIVAALVVQPRGCELPLGDRLIGSRLGLTYA